MAEFQSISKPEIWKSVQNRASSLSSTRKEKIQIVILT